MSHYTNPEELANYFGANPEAPHYLTPVFFKREVLSRYIQNNKQFSVEDGYIRCGSLWGMAIDNHNKEYVSAYLGDLGRDLPKEEQKYWKNYNILIEGKLSPVKVNRDFFAMFAEPDAIDFKFKVVYEQVCESWEKFYGWPMFRKLAQEDEHNFTNIILPIFDTQSEFDGLIASLTKVLIDSINESEITKLIRDGNSVKGSIAKLERWFVETGVTGYEIHIQFLRNLQSLRSSSTAHLKGKNFDKIASKFSIGEKRFVDVYEDILKEVISFLEFLQSIIKA